MKVSGYIITKNNGRSLKWALESVYKYLDEIIIVDSGSTDNTVEIAKQYTDKIYFNEFKDFSDQRNFAIKKCPSKAKKKRLIWLKALAKCLSRQKTKKSQEKLSLRFLSSLVVLSSRQNRLLSRIFALKPRT